MTPKIYPFKIKQIPLTKRPGKIQNNSPHFRHQHEIRSAEKLARFGDDVLFLKPSDIPYVHTADCLWRGELWEMKAPTKNRTENIIGALKEALAQSHRIILDISRSNRNIRQTAKDVISYIEKHRATRIEIVLILGIDEYCEITKSMVI